MARSSTSDPEVSGPNPEMSFRGTLRCRHSTTVRFPQADFWPLDSASLNFRVARQALTASGGVQSQKPMVASEDTRETPRAA